MLHDIDTDRTRGGQAVILRFQRIVAILVEHLAFRIGLCACRTEKKCCRDIAARERILVFGRVELAADFGLTVVRVSETRDASTPMPLVIASSASE